MSVACAFAHAVRRILRRLLEGMFGDAWIDFYPQNMAKADAHPFLLRFRDGNVRSSASLQLNRDSCCI